MAAGSQPGTTGGPSYAGVSNPLVLAEAGVFPKLAPWLSPGQSHHALTLEQFFWPGTGRHLQYP